MPEQSLETLRLLGSQAQKEGRHADAISIFSQIIRRCPNDGEALYQRARTTGWDDRWTEGQRLFSEGYRLAPTHKIQGRMAFYAIRPCSIPVIGAFPC